MHKQIKTLFSVALLSLLLGTAHAGILSVSNSPTAESLPGVTNDGGNNYIFISITNAMTNGVSFTSTNTETNGDVSYLWTFEGGNPGSTNVESPGTVLFPTIAYGQDDVCAVALEHDVDTNVCTSITTDLTNVDSSGVTNVTTHTNWILSFHVVVPKIEPDNSPLQCGVIGDVVPSIVTTGTPQLHFVAPKTTNGSVVLVATAPGVTSSNFNSLLYWDTNVGTAVSGSPNKWQVSTTNTGKFPVILRRVVDDGEVGRYNVWVVWCANIVTTPSMTMTFPSGWSIVTASKIYYQSNILPSSIFNTNNDIPDLMHGLESGFHADAYDQQHALDGKTLGDPLYKWFLTRQWREKVLIPTLNGAQAGFPSAGKIYYTLPNANLVEQTSPVATGSNGYPTDQLEGNDFSKSPTLQNDPYSSTTFALLADNDPPNTGATNTAGSLHDTVECRDQFCEFALVDINKKWYKISDPMYTRSHGKLIKNSAYIWSNNGSISDTSNSGF